MFFRAIAAEIKARRCRNTDFLEQLARQYKAVGTQGAAVAIKVEGAFRSRCDTETDGLQGWCQVIAAALEFGAAVTLTKAPFYYTSVAPKPSCYKSGTFYFYDGILVNNRYRITNTAARCGKLPVGKNVTGWVPASYCNGGGITTK